MDCRAVSSSMSAMAVALLSFMVFAHVCGANMIFELKNKFENLSPEELMTARWEHDQRRDGRSLSAVDLNMGAEAYPGFAIFFAQVVLGDPPSAFSPLIDPMTSLTWVYCNGCKRCPTKSEFKFDINHYEVKDSRKGKILPCDDKMCALHDKDKKEKMCSDNTCKYKIEYGNGGITAGNMVSDTLRINAVTGNNQTSPVFADFVFGCGIDQYNGLEDADWAFDGTFGFGMSNLSMLSQLIASKHVKKNTWSHCFRSDLKGGTLAFGELEMQKKIKMTPLVPNSETYKATILNVTLEGKPLAIDDAEGTLFDISSAYNAFPDSVYNAILTNIQSAFKNLKFSPSNPFSCFLYSGRIDHEFPAITYTFKGGIEMKIHPSQYMFERSTNQWCIGILNSGNRKLYKNYFFVTENTLTGRLVVYDVGNKKIGWTDYNCEKGIKMLDDKTGDGLVVSSHNIGHEKLSAAIQVGGETLVTVLSAMFSYLAL